MPEKKSAGSTLDRVNRESSEAVYEAGFAARGERTAVDACPFGPTNPFRVIWEAGWNAARIAEADCSALLHTLHQSGLTTALLDLDPLDDHQRFALIDWLDSRQACITQGTSGRQQFLDQRPAWVTLTGQVVPADDDQPALQVITFDVARPRLPLWSISDDLLRSGLNTSNAAIIVEPSSPAAGVMAALPPLKETPPSSDAESRLQDLLRLFDDVGVQLVEEQWLAFGDADQHFCTRWARGRLQGIMSPVPLCLIPYATMQLKAEYAPYIDECRVTRSDRLPITFEKPGVIAGGDDDEGKIKVVVKAPYEHLPGTLADRLFRDTACRIHFSTRRPSQWHQQELFAAHPIYVTQSDIKGYRATSDDTSFSFTVDQQTLSIESAFKHLWGQSGTAIVERLGKATKEQSQQPNATSQP